MVGRVVGKKSSSAFQNIHTHGKDIGNMDLIYQHNYILNNRDRTNSDSSSSTMSGHNRGRADTGDSSLSSDTNASNVGPRRRSHRPRGCRGGRKNRKKKNKVPTEIVGPNDASSSTSMTMMAATTTTSSHSTICIKESRGTNPGMRQLFTRPTSGHNATDLTSPVHFPPMTNTGMQAYHANNHTEGYPNVISSTHPHWSKSTQQQQRDAPPPPPPLSNNSMVLNTSTAYSNNSNNIKNNNNSNTDHILDPRSTLGMSSSNTRGPTSNNVPNLAQILPPPPPVPTQEEKIRRGPNPYALSKQQPAGHMAPLAFPPPLGENVGVDENYTFPLMFSSSLHSTATTTAKNKPLLRPMELGHAKSNDDNIAAAICESLFAISPRSFLTGSQQQQQQANAFATA